MSTTKNKQVLRDASGVSELNLPKWDRDGKTVHSKEPKKPVNKVVPTVTPDIEEKTVSAPTVKELEKIREDAYNEGFEQGYEQGLKQGIADGREQGLEQGLETGREQGLNEGRETGRAQAIKDGKIETEKALAVFKSISQALQEYRSEDEQEVEKALGLIAVKIARQVVQDELRTKPSHIKQVVHAAVQALPNPDDKLTLRINPIDYDFVTSTAETNWQLISDDDISVGGCTVKSGFSYVDFTLEHRFETAVKQLINHIDIDTPDEKISQAISDDYLLDNTLAESDSASASSVEQNQNGNQEPKPEGSIVDRDSIDTAPNQHQDQQAPPNADAAVESSKNLDDQRNEEGMMKDSPALDSEDNDQ